MTVLSKRAPAFIRNNGALQIIANSGRLVIGLDTDSGRISRVIAEPAQIVKMTSAIDNWLERGEITTLAVYGQALAGQTRLERRLLELVFRPKSEIMPPALLLYVFDTGPKNGTYQAREYVVLGPADSVRLAAALKAYQH